MSDCCRWACEDVSPNQSGDLGGMGKRPHVTGPPHDPERGPLSHCMEASCDHDGGPGRLLALQKKYGHVEATIGIEPHAAR